MPFLTQGKTNWKYILILLVLAALVGGGILVWMRKQEISPYEFPEIKKPEKIVKEKPYIEVLSPNGGEEWIVGKSYEIKWETKGLEKENVKLSLALPDHGWIVIKDNVAATTGKYSWEIPLDISPGRYKISISWPADVRMSQVKIYDESDEYFSIIAKDETTNWKIYRNEEYGFELRYPEDLLTLSEKEKKIILTHSIPYEHPDPCDFKGNAPPLKKLTDFEVSVEIINKSLRETVIANESDYLVSKFLLDNKLKISPGFIDEFSIGSLKGYRISKGVEGCGTYTYYFPLNSKNTLLIRRSWIAEFNPINADYEKYLKLPGIIPPDKEENLFNQILSTFRFLK